MNLIANILKSTPNVFETTILGGYHEPCFQCDNFLLMDDSESFRETYFNAHNLYSAHIHSAPGLA